ncbi:unnamed protein product [Penicillium salamii]|uniref:Cell wall protein n=1 Tax=Penicillium salamii TaxID=1612424 RepID=A0A9W4NPU6_9EURO|nr:unnamed protein product [Penicillium salamii]
MKPSTLSFLLGLSLSSLTSARTDLEGCVSTEVVINYGASYLWYVPGTGEICTFLDCGGGRAPPKTNQPGCPLYSGTATVTASYIEGYGPNGKQAVSTTTAAATTSTEAVETTASSAGGDSSSASSTAVSTSTATDSSASLITAAPTSSPAVSMTTTTSAVSSDSAAASSTPTGNAAHTAGSNVGVVALMAMVGAMVL